MKRPIGVFVLAAALLAVACKKEETGRPVAGLFALKGSGQVRRGEAWRRSARPGMTLTDDARLALADNSRAVLEGLNGMLVVLGEGEHAMSRVKALSVKPAEKRSVYRVTDKAERREVGPLLTTARYEPVESGKGLPTQDNDTAKGMAYFFTPGGTGAQGSERPAHAAPPPPWVLDKRYVHALRRPLAEGDGKRKLVVAKGDVVVEFQDRATAFATELTLPLDLSDVARVVVLDGTAKLELPGGQLELDDGEEAELH
ncbi:MAG: hypothetical protein ACOX6T_08345 [Myxococcales bacterium]|jgi:hypothetical protein